MLSSISMYVRMLDGRDRGRVVDMNREIALDLIQRKQALEIEDVTAPGALDPWSHDRLEDYRRAAADTRVLPIAEMTAVRAHGEAGDVLLPAASVSAEVSNPRSKNKKR
jgi:hypothetical protein